MRSIFERKRKRKPLFRTANRKGIVFSLDALIALLITGVIIGASFFYLSQVQTISWSQPGMQTMNYDALNILHLDGTFEETVDTGDYSEVSEFFENVFPHYACTNITFYDPESNRIGSVQKSSCNFPGSGSKDVFVARRVFVKDYQIYYVLLQTWYN